MRPKRLGGRVVFRGRVFRVEQERVRLSNGRTAVFDIVRHRGSVVLVPRPSRDSIILIRQYRHVIGRWIWELPAGSLEEGERPSVAARRECAEEIGLRPMRVRRLAAFYPTPGFCDERMDFYLCERLVSPARPAPRDEDEEIEPRTFSIAQAWAMVKRGEIIDMKTIVGLLLISKQRKQLGL